MWVFVASIMCVLWPLKLCLYNVCFVAVLTTVVSAGPVQEAGSQSKREFLTETCDRGLPGSSYQKMQN